MKITKFVHSCLLVETPERAVLFDPGFMSEGLIDIDSMERLDDVLITHEHGDHFYLPVIKRLVEKFPDVRITAPQSVVTDLNNVGIKADSEATEGVAKFVSPHESVEPLFSTPEEHGYHFQDKLTHPGDSHHFDETKAILALPITAPWGSVMNAAKLAVALKPQHVIPIHDWHWRDEVRTGMYDSLAEFFDGQGIHFVKAVNGEPFTIEA
jgi:L-ascorbate metabolism protein UlaG (beta-lactamase superfamily)